MQSSVGVSGASCCDVSWTPQVDEEPAGLGSLVGAAVLLSIGGTLWAPPGQAGEDPQIGPLVVTVCDPYSYDVSMTSTSWTRYITHAKYFSIPAGGSGSQTKSVSKTGSITASATFTSSATVSASAIMAEFSGTVGVTLAASGTYTNQSTESVTVNVGPGAYAFFHGEKKYSGTFQGWKCNSDGTVSSPVSGNAVSFAVPGEGAASCSASYSSGSFEYKAKAIAC